LIQTERCDERSEEAGKPTLAPSARRLELVVTDSSLPPPPERGVELPEIPRASDVTRLRELASALLPELAPEPQPPRERDPGDRALHPTQPGHSPDRSESQERDPDDRALELPPRRANDQRDERSPGRGFSDGVSHPPQIRAPEGRIPFPPSEGRVIAYWARMMGWTGFSAIVLGGVLVAQWVLGRANALAVVAAVLIGTTGFWTVFSAFHVQRMFVSDRHEALHLIAAFSYLRSIFILRTVAMVLALSLSCFFFSMAIVFLLWP
jgi:hypothetical protein